MGASGGTQQGATTADFAGDVEAAIEALAERPDVQPSTVGLVGHSEGGSLRRW